MAAAIAKLIFAKVFEEVFGKQQTVPWNTLMENLVTALADIVAQKISGEVLREYLATSNAVSNMYLKYLNAPDQLDRLNSATTHSEIITSQLASLGFAGHHGYLAASSLAAGIAQERVNVYGSSEIKNFRLTLETAIAHAHGMEKEWRDWNYVNGRRFSKRYELNGWILGYVYYVYKDGKRIEKPKGGPGDDKYVYTIKEKDWEKVAKKYRDEEWNSDLYPNYVSLSEESRTSWNRALKVLS